MLSFYVRHAGNEERQFPLVPFTLFFILQIHQNIVDFYAVIINFCHYNSDFTWYKFVKKQNGAGMY